MSDRKTRQFELRAKLPAYVRAVAMGIIAITVLLIVVGFYRERSRNAFRLKPEHTQLSQEVIAEVNGYERLESDGDVRKYYIKADRAKTFSDNHQELENVHIEVYGDAGTVDKLSAHRALYVPDQDRNFTAYLAGDVGIETRDSLKVKTTNIVYTKKDETAVADDLVEFERDNIRGRSFGANVLVAEKKLNLLRDVDLEMTANENGPTGMRNAKFKGGSATYDQAANKIEVVGSVVANILDANGQRTTDIKADRLIASLLPGAEGRQPSLRDLELLENVWIETKTVGARQTTIETAYALYDQPAGRFELKNGVHIVTGTDESADIRSQNAVYEQTDGKLRLEGTVEVTKGTSYLKGDSIFATLSSAKSVKYTAVNGSAFLRNAAVDRTTEISANQLTADFDDAQQLQNARAAGNARAIVTPTDQANYTSVNVSSPGAIATLFRAGGLISQMKTEGRSTIQLNVPNGASDAANKRVTADTVNVLFNDNGKDIRHAEAIGNAELYIEPLRAAQQNYKTTIFAPRFDCVFYPSNNARECVGAKNTKTVRVPTVSTANRGNQTLLAEKLTARFGESSKDIETLEAHGQTKFTELDRNAVADSMTFTQGDQVVRLRGGEPTFWDANSRAKAPEIDWDTRSQRSALRGGVSTTYYSRKRTGDATPFGSSDKPVFATGQTLDVDHNSEVAVYKGNARAWQDNNYVRADKLVIDQLNGRFDADGAVQSLLYDAKQKQKGASVNVPVSASAASLAYSRDNRVLQYRSSVDIRQGTDRMSAQIADIYLDKNNEMIKTVVEDSVVITQPGRKAVGDWAEYVAANEVAVIRGNPARVDDAESGTSQSGQITVYLRENRVQSEGGTKQNPSARTRSVYKVKNVQ